MRSNAHTMPSALGMHAPERPVPEPRAVTGAPNAAAARKTADTSRASPGRTTASGPHGRGRQRLVVRVLLGNGGVGEHVRGTDGLPQSGDEIDREIGHGAVCRRRGRRGQARSLAGYAGHRIG